MKLKKKNTVCKTQRAGTKESKDLTMPPFGSELEGVACKKPTFSGWFCIRNRFSQRARVFIQAFVSAFGMSLVALCVLYLPDFGLDYARRGENFLTFFFKFLLCAVSLVGVCALVHTALRETVLHVNPQKKLLLIARRITPSSLTQAFPLTEPTRIEAVSTMFGSRYELVLQAHGQTHVLARSMGSDADLVQLRDWLDDVRLS